MAVLDTVCRQGRDFGSLAGAAGLELRDWLRTNFTFLGGGGLGGGPSVFSWRDPASSSRGGHAFLERAANPLHCAGIDAELRGDLAHAWPSSGVEALLMQVEVDTQRVQLR
jgi:hypothetical protein